jgi:uncharacterized protein YecE (DUF72 family)
MPSVDPSGQPSATVRIGTCGWSYPDGRGTWTGVFYPVAGPRRTAARGPGPRGATRFDELEYYAERFNTVEVNSTFYRVPAPSVTASWARRAPQGFEFAVKLFQKFSHPSMFVERHGPIDLSVGRDDVDAFRAAIDPLASAGKLGPLLAQFPPSFKAGAEATDYLRWLLTAFGDYAVAVELRHRSWSDAGDATRALLGEHRAAWVQIDEPKFRFSIAQDLRPNVASFFYMRLHGRNADAWWQHEAVEDRYNYLYTSAELEPIAEAAHAARRLVRKLYLYLNNHFEAKAVANAVMLKARLGEPITGTFDERFVDRFPALRDRVTVTPVAEPRLL